MISDAGVHSHLNHLFTLLKLAKKEGVKNIFIHGITDGRDVPERCAEKYIKAINNEIKKLYKNEVLIEHNVSSCKNKKR